MSEIRSYTRDDAHAYIMPALESLRDHQAAAVNLNRMGWPGATFEKPQGDPERVLEQFREILASCILLEEDQLIRDAEGNVSVMHWKSLNPDGLRLQRYAEDETGVYRLEMALDNAETRDNAR